MQRLLPSFATFLAVSAGGISAFAGDSSFSLGASTSDGVKTESSQSNDQNGSADAAADNKGNGDQAAASSDPVYQAPLELGLFGGLFFPSRVHNLVSKGYEPFRRPNLELGGRLAYFPLQFLGAELEGAVSFSKTDVTDKTATFWMARGHLIGQVPGEFVTPFVLFGGGLLHAGSDVTGSDTDPEMHFGGGVKIALSNTVGLRLDVRDNLSQRHAAAQGKVSQHPEFLLGLSLGIGKPAPVVAPPPPPDSDGDGIIDERDACRDQPGPAPDGCPDTDGDGFFDNKDACPTVAGIAPQGCPPGDKDKDGFTDDVDKCPDVAGPVEGCPDPDPDKDGILGDADKCPTEPEAVNGFEDEDGCPDVVPEKIKKFTGVIKGIEFDVNTDHIRKESTGVLDAAIAVLTEYPALRVMISGHTDSDGTRDHNLDLSKRRAESVKAYFGSKGIAADRIETRGAGPDEPLADNKTKAGKQKNRRIEFKLIEGAAAKAASDAHAAAGASATPAAAPAAPAAPAPAAPAPK